MKQVTAGLIFLLSSLAGTAQRNSITYQMSLGDEIKLKKGTSDLDIIAADNTGMYFSEERDNRGSFSIGGPNVNYKLYKVDKNFGEVFDKDYKRELRGLSFEGFQTMGEDLFLFASDYVKRGKKFILYGAKVDKSNGDLVGDFSELGTYELESRKDDYEMKVSPIHQGKSFLMVSNISAKDRVSLGVCLLDGKLTKKNNVVINLSFAPNEYQLADVQYTMNNKIILLGKIYEETQVGKKKKKRLVFKQYAMSIYNDRGEKEKDVVLDVNNRFVISGRLIEQPSGEMLLAGFYSNAARKDDIDGFFINKVDPDKGLLTLSSFKEINASMLGKNYVDAGDEDDDTKDNKRSRKKTEDEDEEDFPNQFAIRSVDINPVDNSIIISSEISKYTYYSYTTSSYDPGSRSTTTSTYYVHKFNTQDILLINADKTGNIKWMNAIPKSQYEQFKTSSNRMTYGRGYNYDQGDYFFPPSGMPFYSSYKSALLNNQLVLIMNDHVSNNVNPQYGDRVKTVSNFRKKSSVYGLSVDLNTGTIVRKVISSNNDETILMPRHAYVVGNQFLMPSMRMHTISKTELRFAKITVK